MEVYRYIFIKCLSIILSITIFLVSCDSLHNVKQTTNHPFVRDVHFTIKDNDVLIFYNLMGKASQKYKVQLLASINGGKNYSVIPTNITGDVGKNVSPGKDKLIKWNLMEDYPSGLNDAKFQFLIEAHKQNSFGRYLFKYAIIGVVAFGVGTGLALLFRLNKGPTSFPLPPGRPSS